MKSPSKTKSGPKEAELSLQVEDKKFILTEWSETGVPEEGAIKDFVFQLVQEGKQEKKALKLRFADPKSKIDYVGDVEKGEDAKYFVGVVNQQQLSLYPTYLFKVRPAIKVKSGLQQASLADMSRRQLLDELNVKFGSKKSKKQVELKRKYTISFNEEDAKNIDYEPEPQPEKSVTPAEKAPDAGDVLVDILPKQNKSAICVEEVYDINDIIDKDLLSIFDDEDLLKSDFVKKLLPKKPDDETRALACFLNALIVLHNLKYTELRKKDPLPDMQNNQVKDYLFARYSTETDFARTKRRSITPKHRDELLIHCLIVTLVLNHYKDLAVDDLIATFKVQLKQLRKIAAIVGFYLDKKKNNLGINTSYFIFKLPLNKYVELSTKRRRRK